MSATLTGLEQMYDAFTDKLDMMLAVCKTQAERDQIDAQYAALEEQYDECILKAFRDNSPAAQALVKEAKAVTVTLTEINAQLGDIAKVIGYATQAATIAGKIAAL